MFKVEVTNIQKLKISFEHSTTKKIHYGVDIDRETSETCNDFFIQHHNSIHITQLKAKFSCIFKTFICHVLKQNINYSLT